MNRKTNFNHVFASPHPDDIAISLGALVSSWTGSPGVRILLSVFDRGRYQRSGCTSFEHATWVRTTEDLSFARSVNLLRLSLGQPDATARGYAEFDDIFSLRQGTDDKIQDEITGLLESFALAIRAVETIFWIPAGIGSHIDHLVLRDCFFELGRRHKLRLVLYEDLPYAASYTERQIRDHMREFKKTVCLAAPFCEPGIEQIEQKLRCIDHYPSQLGDAERAAAISHAQRVGKDGALAERFWCSRGLAQCLIDDNERITLASRED